MCSAFPNRAEELDAYLAHICYNVAGAQHQTRISTPEKNAAA
jgi:hypothetical protein